MARSFTFRGTRLLASGMFALASTNLARADDTAPPAPWYDRAFQQLETTWKDGRTDLYLPLHIYHLRSSYTRKQIEKLNESTWGLGVGKGSHDRTGDWHGLFVLFFQDSHVKPEYAVGYTYKTFWHVAGEFKVGFGVSAIVTARSDVRHYTPFFVPSPMISLDYQRFSLAANYVPEGKGSGNVLFFSGKYTF